MLGLIDSGELALRRGLAPDRATSREPVSPSRILLVEDDDEHARLVVETLEEAFGDTIVAHARSAADAAELLNGSTWALAIVDRQLRDGHGLDVLDTLRGTDPSLPVVMLTGEARTSSPSKPSATAPPTTSSRTPPTSARSRAACAAWWRHDTLPARTKGLP